MNTKYIIISLMCGLGMNGMQARFRSTGFSPLYKAIDNRADRVNRQVQALALVRTAAEQRTQAITNRVNPAYITAAQIMHIAVQNKLNKLEQDIANNQCSLESLDAISQSIRETEVSVTELCNQPSLPAEAVALYKQVGHFTVRIRLHIIEQVSAQQPVSDFMRSYVSRVLQKIETLRANHSTSADDLVTEKLAQQVSRKILEADVREASQEVISE